jgi:hypothetical protein
MDLTQLAAEFPRDAIHWRAQTLTRNGDKALALAYLDARDVMDRLDDVCGPENWQTRYTETPRGRVLCEIGIRINHEWVWKSDGAGNTDVEGEKGGISDALKRAAVHWGVGRYLYRLDAVWAPCETYQKNGKTHWKAWIGSPWDAVRQKPARDDPRRRSGPAPEAIAAASGSLSQSETLGALKAIWVGLPKPVQAHPDVIAAKDARKVDLEACDEAEREPVLADDEIPYGGGA